MEVKRKLFYWLDISNFLYIIVLLILAGVTIAMLSGDNSAPQKATEAAQKDAIAGAKDEIAMEVQEALLNYYNNTYVEGDGTKEKSIQEVVSGAASTAVDNAKKRNSQLLESSGVSGDKITLETKSYTVTGTIDTNGGITWSDIVASTDGGLDEEIDKTAELKIGDYVEYGVTYKDVYSYHNFDAKTGWRVINPGTKDEETGTYSGVELISTGIPARLGIKFENEEEYINDGNDGNWLGNPTDIEKLENEYENNYFYYEDVSAGLLYNFQKILYVPGKEPSGNGKGCYKEINGKTTDQLTGREFLIQGKSQKVHNVTEKEVCKALRLENIGDTDDISSIDGLKLFWLEDDYRGLGYYENEQDALGLGKEWFDYWLIGEHSLYMTSCDWQKTVSNNGVDGYWDVVSDGYNRRHTSRSYVNFTCL